MMLPQDGYVEALIPNVTLFGYSVFRRAVKVKVGHKGGSLIS